MLLCSVELSPHFRRTVLRTGREKLIIERGKNGGNGPSKYNKSPETYTSRPHRTRDSSRIALRSHLARLSTISPARSNALMPSMPLDSPLLRESVDWGRSSVLPPARPHVPPDGGGYADIWGGIGTLRSLESVFLSTTVQRVGFGV